MTATSTDSNELVDEQFRRAMARVATPVTVVTAMGPSGPLGQTVSAVTRVSDSPAVLSACLQERSPLNPYLGVGSRFIVSVVDESSPEIADTFAGRELAGRPRFTFIDTEWTSGDDGVPRLARTVAWFECQVISTQPVGTHHLYLGRVLNVAHTDTAEPLLHVRGKYRTLAPASGPFERTDA